MKIPQNLPQFLGKKVLLLVTGRRAGKLYFVSDSMIELVLTYDELVPKYSDNEGYSETSWNGKTVRSGSVREVNEEELAKRFTKKSIGSLLSVMKNYSAEDIYLFSSRANEIQKNLPVEMRRFVRMKFVGSYGHASMKRLLEMIDQEQKAKIVKPLAVEADQLLRR